MAQNSKQWVSPDKMNHPAPRHLFPFLTHPTVSFPSHPPLESESLLFLPLPARQLLSLSSGPQPAQKSPYVSQEGGEKKPKHFELE